MFTRKRSIHGDQFVFLSANSVQNVSFFFRDAIFVCLFNLGYYYNNNFLRFVVVLAADNSNLRFVVGLDSNTLRSVVGLDNNSIVHFDSNILRSVVDFDRAVNLV